MKLLNKPIDSPSLRPTPYQIVTSAAYHPVVATPKRTNVGLGEARSAIKVRPKTEIGLTRISHRAMRTGTRV